MLLVPIASVREALHGCRGKGGHLPRCCQWLVMLWGLHLGQQQGPGRHLAVRELHFVAGRVPDGWTYYAGHWGMAQNSDHVLGKLSALCQY